MTSIRLSKDAARDIVSSGKESRTRSIQHFRSLSDSGVADDVTFDNVDVVKSFSASTSNVVASVETTTKTVVVSVGGVSVVTNVTLQSSDTVSEGAIPVITGINCVDGELIATTKYLTLQVDSGTVQPTISHEDVVGSVSTVAGSAVAEVDAEYVSVLKEEA